MMAAVAQEVVTTFIVIGAAMFAAWRLLSAQARVRMLQALQRSSRRLLPPNGHAGSIGFAGARVQRIITALLRRSVAELASGCGSCSGSSAKHGAAAPRHARPSN